MAFGLNKQARLTAEREAADLAEGVSLPLNPPFPYDPLPFDAVFFEVESWSYPTALTGEVS